MTNGDIGTMLRSTGLEVFYDHAEKGTKLPYITYTTTSDNYFADDKTYQKIYALRAVLYTAVKSQELEDQIEAVFDYYGLPWNRDELYETGSKVYMEIYESEVL